MFNKLIRAFQLVSNMGMRYILFRVWYEFSKKSGLLKRKFPTDATIKTGNYTLNKWRNDFKEFPLSPRENIKIKPKKSEKLKGQYDKLLAGIYPFFSASDKSLGKDYDWNTHPESGYVYSNQHWTEIPDLNKDIGDIKYVWEPSRFSWIGTILRYDIHFEHDSSEWLFNKVEHWIDKNPINLGPNYRCSQEISLRVLNWLFALSFYKNSPHLDDRKWDKIMHSIYWQMHHVYKNIHFSRIAVRNNHAITETLVLYLFGSMFPELEQAKFWARKGKRWFEKEIAYQIYEDGTFLQFSMNYHRVVIQLLNLALTFTQKYDLEFNKVVRNRALKSLNFLFQCQDKTSGFLPNYGANDGALFFKFSDEDYRDYRPQLQALSKSLGVKLPYNEDFEDQYWMSVEVPVDQSINKEQLAHFPHGGYYVINEAETMTFIRCGEHKDRPSQADNFHIDIWHKGDNILMDSGSYKYNTDEAWIQHFNGTEGHNSVTVNNENQMLKGPRFIWYFWSQAFMLMFKKVGNQFVFEGELRAFKQLGKEVIHKRKLVKYEHELKWEIIDEISGSSEVMQQHWHTRYPNLQVKSDAKHRLKESYHSDYYGIKEAHEHHVFEAGNKIHTKITLDRISMI